ncbi:glycosyltransferase [Agromyces indicus]|uniref:Glycosyltransferase n=1 Tax=Agromyces indicus TaxID=758919 RepID=A0ABU1FK50_9MICO|nr:glycosyltransferase [Agromyces indicus]MDR5692140.1 glycosyltransferase [Agromyces indicus]
MRILLWHVHGGWTDAFVRGAHEYLLPVDAARGPWGLGTGGRDWPAAREVPLNELHREHVDLVVLQRTEELVLAEALLGRRPGRDVAAVFVEHNTPKPEAVTARHPLAGRDDLTIVHVTHFNQLMWDDDGTPSVVVEHGVPDPGHRYRGDLERMAVVVNEPVRRGRITGTDLLPRFADAGGIDVFGMGVAALPAALGLPDDAVRPSGDLPPTQLHEAMAERRLYLHTPRWTSLGLSLIEAMHLGMPVVALQTTEASRAVPPGAGFLSTNVGELVSAARLLLEDRDEAARLGAAARDAALDRYRLARFLSDWDVLVADLVERSPGRGRLIAVGGERGPRSARWKES